MFILDDCKYSPWSLWTKCDGQCSQSGNRTRQQSLIIDNTSSPNPSCARTKIDIKPCISDPCSCLQGVNCTCELTPWSNWSSCSRTCGGGQRIRNRVYKTNNSAHCVPENLQEVQPCNVDCCPVNGGYSPWSTWSSCSRSCGSGVRKRYRSCTAPAPSCKGKPCKGCTIDIKVCNTKPCGK